MARSERGERANLHFHEAYGVARHRESLEVPILVVLAGSLALVRHGHLTELPVASELVDVLKAVAHVPVGLFAATYVLNNGPLDAAAASALAQIDSGASSLLGAVRKRDEAGSDRDVLQISATVLEESLAFGRHLLSTQCGDPVALAQLARRLGPVLHECIRHATRIQLESLHAGVARIIGELSRDERRTFQVVVSGDHQARVRSLAMQYFEKLLGEPPGTERRLSYGEGVATVEDAVALVGTKRLDAAIAMAFFGDARRLQRDVLGDAAREQLASLRLGDTTALARR